MKIPSDSFERLLDSPLCGSPNGPVIRNGIYLRGITKMLHARYGGGHLTKRSGHSSIGLGIRVHRELREWLESPRRRCVLHPWTEQALKLLDTHGLRLVGAEVPIAHDQLGTRIDLIARRILRGGYALVSVKTGVRRGADAGPRQALPGLFATIKRCERTLDELQVTAERGLARKGHDVIFESALILEVPEGVLREVPAWTADEEMQDVLLKDLGTMR